MAWCDQADDFPVFLGGARADSESTICCSFIPFDRIARIATMTVGSVGATHESPVTRANASS